MIHGVVVQSKPDRVWLVYWENFSFTSDHKGREIQYEGPKQLADSELSCLQAKATYVGDANALRARIDLRQNSTGSTMLTTTGWLSSRNSTSSQESTARSEGNK